MSAGFFMPSSREQQRMRRRFAISDFAVPVAVKMLLNMVGSSGSTTFTDSALAPHMMTAIGNVKVSTALGYNTALFDGSGDRITTPYVPDDFDWWKSDYTIEAWIYPVGLSTWSYLDSTQNPAMFGCADPSSNTNYWSFGPRSDGKLLMYYYNGSPQRIVSAGTVPDNALTHIAMSKTSSGVYLSIAGIVESPAAIVGTPQSSATGVVLTLGQISNRSINGHVRAVRVTKGLGRYTGNFTPPTAPFPNP